jgi:tetratricopeptide (TPR) repeat protein
MATAPLVTEHDQWADIFADGIARSLGVWLELWRTTTDVRLRAAVVDHALAALDWSAQMGGSSPAVDLALSIQTDVLYAADWRRWQSCLQAIARATTEQLDVRRRTLLGSALCNVAYRLGRFHEAIALGTNNLAEAEALGDPVLIAAQHIALAEIHAAHAMPTQALAHSQLAVSIADTGSNVVQKADARINLAWALMGDGQAAEAEPHLREALALTDGSGQPAYHGKAWLFLGHALRRLGKLDEALDSYKQALDCVGVAGDHNGRGVIMTSMSGVLIEQKRWSEGEDMLRGALEIVGVHGNQQTVARIEEMLAALHTREAER